MSRRRTFTTKAFLANTSICLVSSSSLPRGAMDAANPGLPLPAKRLLLLRPRYFLIITCISDNAHIFVQVNEAVAEATTKAKAKAATTSSAKKAAATNQAASVNGALIAVTDNACGPSGATGKSSETGV